MGLLSSTAPRTFHDAVSQGRDSGARPAAFDAIGICYNRCRGEVAERLMALVSKTSIRFLRIVGSNPTLSGVPNFFDIRNRCVNVFFTA